ncbi:MAG: phage integrase N-terminal SAM-like domain-containing protein [Nitrincola lacisaponensis]|uniref:phage integrase N-terminal SAM-like domain-containing protein n=1 Tax=Nitrincola lacisaponensis TaxID=267850 RepID=UPI00391D9CD6
MLQSVHQEMLRRRYAKRTIETYLHWIKRFILFHQKRHPETMGDAEVEAFLDHLVLKREVAAGTQALMLNTLCFLYRDIIGRPLSLNLNFVKSQRPRKLPVDGGNYP